MEKCTLWIDTDKVIKATFSYDPALAQRLYLVLIVPRKEDSSRALTDCYHRRMLEQL